MEPKTLDLEKLMAEVGRLHLQVMVLTEHNAKLQAETREAKVDNPTP